MLCINLSEYWTVRSLASISIATLEGVVILELFSIQSRQSVVRLKQIYCINRHPHTLYFANKPDVE